MSDRPSDGMALDELRDEFDWIIEFQGRMAERICGDADVHNLADYVSKLEVDNAKLRELCATVIDDWMSKVCPSFPFCEYGGEYQDCTDETCGNQIYRQMARELGVEVD